MGARTSAGQRRAAKVRARRGRRGAPERARGLRARGRPDGPQPPQPLDLQPPLDPLDVLGWVDPLEPDDELLLAALELAVLRTVDTESPDVGDEVAYRIGELDREYLDRQYDEAVEELEFLGDLGEFTSTYLTSDEWASTAGNALGECLGRARRHEDAAVVAQRVLRWVEERLGRSGPALEQQAILLGGPGAPRPLDIGQCLLEDVVAVRVWLVAGLVAVTGSDGPAALVAAPGSGGPAASPTLRGADTRPLPRRHAAAAR